MKTLLFRMTLSLMFVGFCLSLFANPYVGGKKKVKNEDVGTTITLVTSGTGNTKEDATKNALRGALEQTYGAFVSSNTKVVNDELVKDEIVSISTGNIVSYDVLNYIDSNPKQVTVKVVVSITKLQSYAQNKGMSAELAGNTFAMNRKMEELNLRNQEIVLQHLLDQTEIMSQNLFDYELKVKDPMVGSHGIEVPVTIWVKANKNTLAYYDYFHNTMNSIALDKVIGCSFSSNLAPLYDLVYIPNGYLEPLRDKHNKKYTEQPNNIDKYSIQYKLRKGNINLSIVKSIFKSIEDAIFNCEIKDNLGNVSGFSKNISSQQKRLSPFRWYVTNKLVTTNLSIKRNRDGYFCKVDLTDPIAGECGFWMNALKPNVGEKLYEMELLLIYSDSEISRVSKIEIRPKINY